MGFPIYRPRRTRATENLRSMIRETELSVNDLIYPLFVVPGKNVKHEIESLPGNYHWSLDRLPEVLDEITELKIPAVILFGIPSYKNATGSSAWDMEEPVQQACRLIKEKYPDLVIVTDVCLCEYTEHGHCGVLENGCTVNNDATLPLLAKVAVSHAKAGADIIAPSNMMDGYVKAIRTALDEEGFTNIPIMHIPQNLLPHITARSAPQPIPHRNTATAKATRWTLPTATKHCAKLNLILKKAPTLLWLNQLWPLWISSAA